eukprot:2544059-Amphidinium_carterae.1
MYALPLEDDNSAVATYEKVQTNYLHSTVVQAVPGINTYTINGQSFSVNLPAENSPTGGIIWSDPCISSRFRRQNPSPCDIPTKWPITSN